jgi:hypothetical protein
MSPWKVRRFSYSMGWILWLSHGDPSFWSTVPRFTPHIVINQSSSHRLAYLFSLLKRWLWYRRRLRRGTPSKRWKRKHNTDIYGQTIHATVWQTFLFPTGTDKGKVNTRLNKLNTTSWRRNVSGGITRSFLTSALDGAESSVLTPLELSDWLRAGRPRGHSSSPGRVKNFLFSSSSRPTLGSTQPPIQSVP